MMNQLSRVSTDALHRCSRTKDILPAVIFIYDGEFVLGDKNLNCVILKINLILHISPII
jgi:hypothetical protein